MIWDLKVHKFGLFDKGLSTNSSEEMEQSNTEGLRLVPGIESLKLQFPMH